MKRERHDSRAAGKPEKILRRGVFDSDFTALIFPPLACQNFSATEMISQARCVFVCTAAAAAAAVGAALLGVVDGDNVALWLELTTTVRGRGLLHHREEKGGEARAESAR